MFDLTRTTTDSTVDQPAEHHSNHSNQGARDTVMERPCDAPNPVFKQHPAQNYPQQKLQLPLKETPVQIRNKDVGLILIFIIFANPHRQQFHAREPRLQSAHPNGLPE